MQLETNVPEFTHALSEFIRFYAVSIPKALRYQGRLLAQEFIRKTPSRTRSQGRHAVGRDIQRAVRPLRPQDFSSREIRTLIRKRDYAALTAVFSHFPNDLRGASVVPFSAKLHTQARDRRGRVQRFQRKATPDADLVNRYIAQVRGKVGEAKGGWAASLIGLEGRPAAWIAQHAGSGTFDDHAHDLVGPYIRMTNQSEWAGGGDEDRVIADSLRSRSMAILIALAKAQDGALKQSFTRPNLGK
jgi:hypothetical protein